MSNTIYIIIISYFVFGWTALAIFEQSTKRITKSLERATSETQEKLAGSGYFMGFKTAKLLFIIITMLFWPAVFIGAIQNKLERKVNGESKQ